MQTCQGGKCPVWRTFPPLFFRRLWFFRRSYGTIAKEFYAKAVMDMKAQRPYVSVSITPKGEAALVKGHPWVYEAEVTAVAGPVADGDLVDVVSRKGSWLGTGFYNSHSKIRVRLISRNANDKFDETFWVRRLRYAWTTARPSWVRRTAAAAASFSARRTTSPA